VETRNPKAEKKNCSFGNFMSVFLTKCEWGDTIRRDELRGACSACGGEGKYMETLGVREVNKRGNLE
jgi:hypothetical protein